MSPASHLDVLWLQIVNGLLILLSHGAARRAAHKILPRAAEAVSEAGLPHCVVVHPFPAAWLRT